MMTLCRLTLGGWKGSPHLRRRRRRRLLLDGLSALLRLAWMCDELHCRVPTSGIKTTFGSFEEALATLICLFDRRLGPPHLCHANEQWVAARAYLITIKALLCGTSCWSMFAKHHRCTR